MKSDIRDTRWPFSRTVTPDVPINTVTDKSVQVPVQDTTSTYHLCLPSAARIFQGDHIHRFCSRKRCQPRHVETEGGNVLFPPSQRQVVSVHPSHLTHPNEPNRRLFIPGGTRRDVDWDSSVVLPRHDGRRAVSHCVERRIPAKTDSGQNLYQIRFLPRFYVLPPWYGHGLKKTYVRSIACPDCGTNKYLFRNSATATGLNARTIDWLT